MRLSVLLLLAPAVALAVPADPIPHDEDARAVVGEWAVAEVVADPALAVPADLAGARFVFLERAVELRLANKANTRRVFATKFDSRSKPRSVTLTMQGGLYDGRSVVALYALDGDTLRLCMTADPERTERPQDFTAPEGSKRYMFTLTRVRK
jgi:uncharacterized protein (TIGR03067 family)